MDTDRFDAVVVGSGPNGLSAAVRLAAAGWSVVVVEAADTIGGGTRSAELTLPGFVHDVCAAVHALGMSSPALSADALGSHELEWVWPDVPLAHPLDGCRAGVLHRGVADTAAGLGADGRAWRRLIERLVDDWADVVPQLLGPLLTPPRHPLVMARFGLKALQQDFQKRGFARAVGADDADAIAAQDAQRETLDHRAVGKRLDEALGLYHQPAGGAAVDGAHTDVAFGLPRLAPCLL